MPKTTKKTAKKKTTKKKQKNVKKAIKKAKKKIVKKPSKKTPKKTHKKISKKTNKKISKRNSKKTSKKANKKISKKKQIKKVTKKKKKAKPQTNQVPTEQAPTEQTQANQNPETIPTLEAPKPKKIRLPTKIKHLLEVKNLEELFYLVHLLEIKELALFFEGYKQLPESQKSQEINKVIISADEPYDVVKLLRKELASKLDSEYQDVKSEISDLRKAGHDTYVVALIVSAVPQKIKIFEATEEKKDFYKVKKILEKAKTDVEEIKTKQPNKKILEQEIKVAEIIKQIKEARKS